MSAKPQKRPANTPKLIPQEATGDDVARGFRDLANAMGSLERERKTRDVLAPVNLVVGANVLNHGLGRRPLGANVSPTVADAGFAAAMTSANDKQVTITVIGIAQSNAAVELY